MMRRLPPLWRIALLALLFAAPFILSQMAARWPTNARTGQPAPDFSAPLLGGDTVRLSDYQGGGVVLNFWATWCGPCRFEMPLFQSLHESSNVTVLTINNAETPAQIQAFMQEMRLSLPVVLDERAILQALYGIVGYPTSVFIDAAGTVTAVHAGPLDAETLAAYVAEITHP